MLDLHLLRSDIDAVAKRLADRGYTLNVSAFADIEQQRKAIQTETQELQARRNALSKQVGQAKAQGLDASDLMAQVSADAERLKAL
jgi:seryl-tRNA synthetase